MNRPPVPKKNRERLRAFYADISHAPDSLLELWIARIRNGERGKEIDGIARNILRDFSMRQWMDQSHSQVTLDWLADVIEQVLDHADPSELLGLLPRPKHRPPDPMHPGGEVAIWLQQAQRRGYTESEAINLASEIFGRETKSIERYRREARTLLTWVNPDARTWHDYFLTRKPPAPLPPVRNKNSRVPVPTKPTQD